MLYPLTVPPSPHDPEENPNVYRIAPGSMHAFPFELAAGACAVVFVGQAWITGEDDAMFLRQDHSLRVWISDRPGGNAVPDYRATWNANSLPNFQTPFALAGREQFAFSSGVQPAEQVTQTYDVASGRYYVTILNLTNATNAYKYTLVMS